MEVKKKDKVPDLMELTLQSRWGDSQFTNMIICNRVDKKSLSAKAYLSRDLAEVKM